MLWLLNVYFMVHNGFYKIHTIRDWNSFTRETNGFNKTVAQHFVVKHNKFNPRLRSEAVSFLTAIDLKMRSRLKTYLKIIHRSKDVSLLTNIGFCNRSRLKTNLKIRHIFEDVSFSTDKDLRLTSRPGTYLRLYKDLRLTYI